MYNHSFYEVKTYANVCHKVKKLFGDNSKEVTPVPMPNTEVKLLSADCSEGFPFVRVGRRHAIIPA